MQGRRAKSTCTDGVAGGSAAHVPPLDEAASARTGQPAGSRKATRRSTVSEGRLVRSDRDARQHLAQVGRGVPSSRSEPSDSDRRKEGRTLKSRFGARTEHAPEPSALSPRQ
jgi:hypothetical protein